jgi:hypothetical protein
VGAHGPGGGRVTIDERLSLQADPLTVEAANGLEGLIESTVALRRELVTHEAVCRRVLSDVQVGLPMGCVLPAVAADTWRSALTDAIKGFEMTRHHARLVLVAMSLDEGCTIAEVARTWGVSRQLASRWVQEAASLRPAVVPEDQPLGLDGPLAIDAALEL